MAREPLPARVDEEEAGLQAASRLGAQRAGGRALHHQGQPAGGARALEPAQEATHLVLPPAPDAELLLHLQHRVHEPLAGVGPAARPPQRGQHGADEDGAGAQAGAGGQLRPCLDAEPAAARADGGLQLRAQVTGGCGVVVVVVVVVGDADDAAVPQRALDDCRRAPRRGHRG